MMFNYNFDKVVQLSEQEAIDFANSRKWKKMTALERARFQIDQECMAMPSDIFLESICESIGRKINFGTLVMNINTIRAELYGAAPADHGILVL